VDGFEGLLSRLHSIYLTREGIRAKGLPFKNYLLWGAGSRGELIKEYFETLGGKAICFVDNDIRIHGSDFCGLQVHSLSSALKNFPGLPFFIASDHYKAIMHQLKSMGAVNCYAMPMSSFYYWPMILEKNKNDIELVFSWLCDSDSREIFASIVKTYLTGDDGYLKSSNYPQYFHPLVKPSASDIIIDGGAFNGDTCLQFCREAPCDHIVAFEPSKNAFATLSDMTADLCCNVTCVNKGLWTKRDELSFATFDNAQAGNRISKHGMQKIDTISIDEAAEEFELPLVDMIKLDVEGAEMEALRGAVKTIKKHQPKLQICLYHNITDLWVIPKYVRTINASYELYMGHHSIDPHETVLYAC
jgi:FkbM family methyltransferase